MKKIYTKPEIMFESFALSSNIAGDCEMQTNLPSNSTCGLDFSGLKVFLDGMGGCSDIEVDNVGGDGEYNGICYHVMTGGKNLFAS
ncbi:MAG: hypothetical protein IJZ85_02555 [Lachnospiraceae bacterium]|nr:hypothetical protein [Lachnospiraceae bacterium]